MSFPGAMDLQGEELSDEEEPWRKKKGGKEEDALKAAFAGFNLPGQTPMNTEME